MAGRLAAEEVVQPGLQRRTLVARAAVVAKVLAPRLWNLPLLTSNAASA